MELTATAGGLGGLASHGAVMVRSPALILRLAVVLQGGVVSFFHLSQGACKGHGGKITSQAGLNGPPEEQANEQTPKERGPANGPKRLTRLLQAGPLLSPPQISSQWARGGTAKLWPKSHRRAGATSTTLHLSQVPGWVPNPSLSGPTGHGSSHPRGPPRTSSQAWEVEMGTK